MKLFGRLTQSTDAGEKLDSSVGRSKQSQCSFFNNKKSQTNAVEEILW